MILSKSIHYIITKTCHKSGQILAGMTSIVLTIDFYFFRDVEIGDVVTIGECRPLSKTVRFNVLKVTKGTGAKKSFKKF